MCVCGNYIGFFCKSIYIITESVNKCHVLKGNGLYKHVHERSKVVGALIIFKSTSQIRSTLLTPTTPESSMLFSMCNFIHSSSLIL